MLPDLPLLRLTFTYRLRQRLPYPAWQGSLWRGALGYALKEAICIYNDPFARPCPTCILYRHCAYPPVFEPAVADSESGTNAKNVSRPFILEPPRYNSPSLPAGEQLTIALVLLGPALRDLTTIMRTAALLGERGLGRQSIQASLTEVTAHGLSESVTIWPNDNRLETKLSAAEIERLLSYLPDGVLPSLPLIQAEDIRQAAAQLPPDLTLNFLTLTRLKRNKRFVKKPDPETVMRTLLRRVMSLAQLYGTTWIVKTHELITSAANLSMSYDTDWQPASHVSTRQKRRMPLDGFKGRLTLYAVPEEIRALLLLGSFVHIGKLATFGHGWYVIESA
jgi:hypothetical protein